MKIIKDITAIHGAGLAEQLELMSLLSNAINPESGKTFMELMREYPKEWKEEYLSSPDFLRQTISDVLEERRQELAKEV